MSQVRTSLRRFLAPAVLAAVATTGITASAHAEKIYGLGGAAAPGLVSFDSATPGTVTGIGFLSGLPAGFSMYGIDFRPATGELYGVSYNGQLGQLQLNKINLTTAAVTPVGTATTVQSLDTGSVSLDFNPVSDRARVITGDRFNLRFDPDTGALAGTDTPVAWAAGDVFSTAPGPTIVGIAYTNNNSGATQTTLYSFELGTRSVGTVGSVNGTPNSPNTGLVSTVANNSGLSFLNSTDVGFDISGATGVAYLSSPSFFVGNISPETGQGLYTVNLATGAATFVGDFGGEPVRDISVQPVPEPATFAAAGALAGMLLRRKR